MTAVFWIGLSAFDDEEMISRKCCDCIYCKKNGFVENNCHLSVCNFIYRKENFKRKRHLKYDLTKAIICDDCQAENCSFYIRKENK